MSHRDQVNRLLAKQKPLVVGAISTLDGLASPTDGCDLIELRIDALGLGTPVRDFALSSPLPLLITARGPSEGGQGCWSLEQRAEAYLSLLPTASLIDIELRDFDKLEEIIGKASESGILVIGSFHDFERTPPLETLTCKRDSRADLHKFALMARSTADIQIHLSLADSLADTPFSLMGMGPLGAAARPLMARAGSLLNYGYLGETPTAPDQWPASLLGQTLRL